MEDGVITAPMALAEVLIEALRFPISNSTYASRRRGRGWRKNFIGYAS